jgi:hypothetical protein
MVYDEGFEVRIGSDVFFAFSKYRTIDNKMPTDEDDEQTKGYESLCDQTFMGWLINKESNMWSCYFGKKKESLNK